MDILWFKFFFFFFLKLHSIQVRVNHQKKCVHASHKTSMKHIFEKNKTKGKRDPGVSKKAAKASGLWNRGWVETGALIFRDKERVRKKQFGFD